MADEIQTILSGAELVDLNKQEISDDADVYLLAFEITQAAIPVKIMDVLENLEGKTILCCVTRARTASSITFSPSYRMNATIAGCFSVRARFRPA